MNAPISTPSTDPYKNTSPCGTGVFCCADLICRQPDPDGPVIRGSYSTRAGWGFPPPAAGTVENRVNPKPWSLASGFSPALIGGYISGQSCPLSRWPVFRRMSTVPSPGILSDIQAPCREAPLAGAVLPTSAPSGSGRLPQCPACDAPARQKTPPPGTTRRGSFQFRLKPDGYSPAFSVRQSSANWACMAAPRCSTSSGTLYFSWWLV